MCTSVQYLSKCTTEAWKWKCLRGVCWSTVLFCTSHLHALMRCLCDSDSCDEGGSDQQIFITQKSSAVRKQAGHVTVSPCPPCSSAPVSTAAAHRHKVSYLALVCVLRRCMVHVCLSVCLSVHLSVCLNSVNHTRTLCLESNSPGSACLWPVKTSVLGTSGERKLHISVSFLSPHRTGDFKRP